MFKIKRFLVGLSIGLLVILPFRVFAASEESGISADEALKLLVDGNNRFVSGKLEAKNLGDERRKELTQGQKPFATILSCSDSRVPPEHIFNQGLGDIFIIRVAGNVVDPIELGSVEYGAEHLNVPLVMVLGHRDCGAVKATLAGGEPEGNIGAIVKKIAPAVNTAKGKTTDKDALLDTAIEENVRLTVNALTEKSPLLKHLVENGKLKIVAGIYDLSSGKVKLLDLGEKKIEKK